MPKGILEFKLPEEKEEFEEAQKGGIYKLVLWDLDQHLRGIIKYNNDKHDEKSLEAFQKTRDTLHEFLKDYELDL